MHKLDAIYLLTQLSAPISPLGIRPQLVPPQLNQDRLHCVLALPGRQAGQLLGVDDAVVRVDARDVDHADKFDRGWLVRVFGTAVHLDRVDAVLVDALYRLPIKSALVKPCIFIEITATAVALLLGVVLT